ncbi:MAG TPA: twin-arginine translocase TatA/TatE family subunit [Chloroflexota bacterium]|nr:twin-arginine translocase TatA/TatE family subunit [Chloroflexota bacterium]
MNLFGLSPGELLLILLVAMVVLGPEKIPEVAASIGRWIREFRRATEELSAQFAGENPLYEIQRALSLTDEPAPPAPVPTPAADTAPAEVLPAPAAPPVVQPPAEPIRSSYFLYPPYYDYIADDWTHGALNGDGVSRRRAVFDDSLTIGDDWTHGVPRTLDGAPDSSPLASSGDGEQCAEDSGLQSGMGVVALSSETVMREEQPAGGDEADASVELASVAPGRGRDGDHP